ncbi:MAG TPA: phosphohistidine phosphatase SixA [Candidatus Methylomirabilis sp.]|nr:phosphohistidine phosphatase SixA [Candidatus Methylomirabilis sp.]
MLKLYFLRHGEAGSRQEWRGDDAERPLTAAGKKRMKREGAAMWKLKLPLDLIISSPLARALQTAEIVAKAQRSTARLITDGRLRPGFGPKHLAALLAEHRDARGVMLVGHEPDFSETISRVTGGGRLEMKKGALAYVEVEDRASVKGTLVWLIPPKALDL